MNNGPNPSGGIWTFLPYGLPVLGAGLGVFYANAGGGNANPLIWLAVGLVAGRLLAMVIARLAGWLGFGA